MYDVTAVRSCHSFINQLLIIQENPLLESSPKLLLFIRFIRVSNINKNKLVEDQLKVIIKDVLYTLNKMYKVLQVVKRFNQRLFSMEDLLKVVEEGLKEAKKVTAVKA